MFCPYTGFNRPEKKGLYVRADMQQSLWGKGSADVPLTLLCNSSTMSVLIALSMPKKTKRSWMDMLYENNQRTINQVKHLGRFHWFRKWIWLKRNEQKSTWEFRNLCKTYIIFLCISNIKINAVGNPKLYLSYLGRSEGKCSWFDISFLFVHE